MAFILISPQHAPLPNESVYDISNNLSAVPSMYSTNEPLPQAINVGEEVEEVELPLIDLQKLSSDVPEERAQPQPPPSSFPRNPSSGSPFYHQNWRNLNPTASASASSTSLVPVGFNPRSAALSQTLDAASLSDVFADYMASQRWGDLKELFEFWIRSLNASGKPNRPDVGLFNHYLRANLMMGATAGELLDLVAQMEYEINLVGGNKTGYMISQKSGGYFGCAIISLIFYVEESTNPTLFKGNVYPS